jgi:predicted enzyme related to lactoylglutathione lyase
VLKLTQSCLDVGIVTNDLEGQIRFYGETLGLSARGSVDIPGMGTITRFSVGESMLRLLVPLQPAAATASEGGFAATQGIRYIALKIAGLAEVVGRIEAAGFRITVPIRELRPGVRVALVEDGDGNTVELMEEMAP